MFLHFSNGLEASIVRDLRSAKILPNIDLALQWIPPFVRLHAMELFFNAEDDSNSIGIEEKCELSKKLFKALKPALNDESSFDFYLSIDENSPHKFRNHSQLLDFLHTNYFPICTFSRRHEFYNICFDTDQSSMAATIATILQQYQIVQCESVEFDFDDDHGSKFTSLLPIEAISNWLTRSAEAFEAVDDDYEQTLTISLEHPIQNTMELFDYLKKVIQHLLVLRLFYESRAREGK